MGFHVSLGEKNPLNPQLPGTLVEIPLSAGLGGFYSLFRGVRCRQL